MNDDAQNGWKPGPYQSVPHDVLAPEQVETLALFAAIGSQVSGQILSRLRGGRYRSMALRALEDAMMYARKSVTHDNVAYPVDPYRQPADLVPVEEPVEDGARRIFEDAAGLAPHESCFGQIEAELTNNAQRATRIGTTHDRLGQSAE